MKIFYINLDSRVDRKDFFLNQFCFSILNPERISAVALSGDNFNIASPGVAGCWNSHQKAYKSLLKSRDSHALIFEDDAIISSKVIRILENLKHLSLDGIDLFQLGYLKDRNKLTVDSGKIDFLYRWKLIFFTVFRIIISQTKKVKFMNLWRINNNLRSLNFENEWKRIMGMNIPLVYNSFEAGTHCYIISRRLAQALISFNNNPVIISADLLLIEVANSRIYNCFRVSKSLSSQKSALGSDINLKRQKSISVNFKRN